MNATKTKKRAAESIWTDEDVCSAMQICTRLDADLAAAERRLAELQTEAAEKAAHDRAVAAVLAGEALPAAHSDLVAEAKRNIGILRTAITRADEALDARKSEAARRIFGARAHELDKVREAANVALNAAMAAVREVGRVNASLRAAGLDIECVDLDDVIRKFDGACGDLRRAAGIRQERKAVRA